MPPHEPGEARPTPSPVVVGYDGSELARAAVTYALERVQGSGELVLAHAVSPPSVFIETPYYERALEPARARAAEILRDVDVPGLGDVPFTTEVVEGPPAATLVELARRHGAAEIVLGSRGFGTLRAPLGSVSHAVLHESDRPVAIVPRQAAERLGERPRGDARVTVVGYDGSDHARRALAYSLDTLADRGRVVAVHAYAAPADWLGSPYYDRALADHRLRAEEILGTLRYPEDVVERDLVEGAPADVLAGVAEVRAADAIVVGSRGLGVVRAGLGSVSHALLHEATRPVVVVPARASPPAI